MGSRCRAVGQDRAECAGHGESPRHSTKEKRPKEALVKDQIHASLQGLRKTVHGQDEAVPGVQEGGGDEWLKNETVRCAARIGTARTQRESGGVPVGLRC